MFWHGAMETHRTLAARRSSPRFPDTPLRNGGLRSEIRGRWPSHHCAAPDRTAPSRNVQGSGRSKSFWEGDFWKLAASVLLSLGSWAMRLAWTRAGKPRFLLKSACPACRCRRGRRVAWVRDRSTAGPAPVYAVIKVAHENSPSTTRPATHGVRWFARYHSGVLPFSPRSYPTF